MLKTQKGEMKKWRQHDKQKNKRKKHKPEKQQVESGDKFWNEMMGTNKTVLHRGKGGAFRRN